MIIEVSMLPPGEYSPNWRGYWARRYRAGEDYKVAVFYHCVDIRNKMMTGAGWQPFFRARIDLTFIFREERVRDEDNMRARFKPGLDAIVAAGLIFDDNPSRLITGDIHILVNPARAPLTIIELTEQNLE